jgi:hypothetical protein
MAQQAVATDQFREVYTRLRGLLESLTDELKVVDDKPGIFTVASPKEGLRDPEAYFGGVRLGKRYVSYYLMPVYVNPALLMDISPELKRRMQGKSCFNFVKVDDVLLDEVRQLTQRGLESYRAAGIV